MSGSSAGEIGHSRLFLGSCVAATFTRAALVVYADWIDAAGGGALKYTDVDYDVTTDGARLISLGRSPYERATYRYSPLLALSLVPNITLHRLWGKALFVATDLITAWLIYSLALARGDSQRRAEFASAAWLWNPLALGISTRGSSDSIACAMVCATLLGLVLTSSNESGRSNRSMDSGGGKSSHSATLVVLGAGSVHGLSVHWRIYPIIFAPTVLLFYRTWTARVLFGGASFGMFAALGIASYVAYGDDFLRETFLYHVSRADHRHNFSVWFYSLYLESGSGGGGIATSLSAFGPQALVQAAIIARFARRDIVFCFFLQTVLFVVFNKVVTAQYFVWYASLLPLALFSTSIGPTRFLVWGVLPWAVAELHWLWWAYQLEFLGRPTFREVWAAGLLFFLVNVAEASALVVAHCRGPDDRARTKEE